MISKFESQRASDHTKANRLRLYEQELRWQEQFSKHFSTGVEDCMSPVATYSPTNIGRPPMLGVVPEEIVAEMTYAGSTDSDDNRAWWNPRQYLAKSLAPGNSVVNVPTATDPNDVAFFQMVRRTLEDHCRGISPVSCDALGGDYSDSFMRAVGLKEMCCALGGRREKHGITSSALDIGAGMGVMLGTYADMQPWIKDIWGSNLTEKGWLCMRDNYRSLYESTTKMVGGIEILEALQKISMRFEIITALRSVSNLMATDFRGEACNHADFLHLCAGVQQSGDLLIFDLFHSNAEDYLRACWKKPVGDLNRYFYTDDQVKKLFDKVGAYEITASMPYSLTPLLTQYFSQRNIPVTQMQTHHVISAVRI